MSKYDEVMMVIKNPDYIKLSKKIAQISKLPIEEELFVGAKTMLLDKLKFSNCTKDDLLNCIENDYENVFNYVIKKFEYLDHTEKEGSDVKFSIISVFGHLCEFNLLKNKRIDELINYFKKERIPAAKKYANELNRIFQNIE